MKTKKYDGKNYKFKKRSIEKTRKKYKTTYLYIINTILKYKKYIYLLQKELNIEEENINEIDCVLLKVMESTAKDFHLNTYKVYTSSKFNKKIKKEFQKIRKEEKKTHSKSKLKIIKVYEMVEKKDYKNLRILALTKPKDFLKGTYLYTICED